MGYNGLYNGILVVLIGTLNREIMGSIYIYRDTHSIGIMNIWIFGNLT